MTNDRRPIDAGSGPVTCTGDWGQGCGWQAKDGDSAVHSTAQPKDNDPVNHPSHYTNGSIECIDAIEAAVADLNGIEGFLTAQCLKYLWRWKLKNAAAQDLKKCRWYLDRLIAYTEAKEQSHGRDY